VTSFGIFGALDDVYVEGLVHISELGRTISISTPPSTACSRPDEEGVPSGRKGEGQDRPVDLETSRIDFVAAGESASGPRHMRRSLRRRVRS